MSKSGAAGGLGGELAGGLGWLVCWVVELAGWARLVGCRGWTGCRVGWFGELAGWAAQAGRPGAGSEAPEKVGRADWFAEVLGLVGLIGLAC